MNDKILDHFIKYVIENIDDESGKVNISKDIEDNDLQDIVQKLSIDYDDYMDLEDLFLNTKKLIPENYPCGTELLLSYEAGIGDENGSIVLLHRFGEKGIIQYYLTGGCETFLFDQLVFEFDGEKIDLEKDLIDMVQWDDAPHIQLNSLLINKNYINLDDFFNHVHFNLAGGLDNDMLISLNCHTDHIETEAFLKRLSKAEKDEVLKIDKHGYDWDSYDKELLKSAFVKGILKES